MRRLVLGDVHGAIRALLQVIERSKIDREKDLLVFVGDVADGWPNTKECIDCLLGFDNLVHLLGNHDKWMLDWAQKGWKPPIWVSQGGEATLHSYGYSRISPMEVPALPNGHRAYLEAARAYYELDGKLFVHGGIPYAHQRPDRKAQGIDPEVLSWDRDMWNLAQTYERRGKGEKVTSVYDEIFIGHTSTYRVHRYEDRRQTSDTFGQVIEEIEGDTPQHFANVWNLDQGAGWNGKLSIMDIDTKEYWQSDNVLDLYPDHPGRGR